MKKNEGLHSLPHITPKKGSEQLKKYIKIQNFINPLEPAHASPLRGLEYQEVGQGLSSCDRHDGLPQRSHDRKAFS